MTASITTATAIDGLVDHSLEVIRAGQAPSGAYVASPTYPTYGYAWLRDGSFCAYAMALHGALDSAMAFHLWVADTIVGHRDRVEAATRVALEEPSLDRMLPTRFTLDGRVEADAGEAWPNFQLDGYATWLWTLGQHLERVPSLGPPTRAAARLVADYLSAAADLPCYDCWEEFGDGHHTSTLGALVAGLSAAGRYLDDPALTDRAASLRDRLLDQHVVDGALVKQIGDPRVDASALWLALPFGVLAPDDRIVLRTADRIRDELVRDGNGVTRYRGDTFYGGGAWVLLTAWLAWHELVTGRDGEADRRRRWILEARTDHDDLPEQVLRDPQAPEHVQPWVQRWGPVATPLLWSHAMFLVLEHHRADRGAMP